MSRAAWYSLLFLLSSSMTCLLSPESSLFHTLSKVFIGVSSLALLASLAIGRRIKFDPVLPD